MDVQDLWIRHAGWVTSTLLAGGATLFLQDESLPLELRAAVQIALWLTALDAGTTTSGRMHENGVALLLISSPHRPRRLPVYVRCRTGVRA